MHKNNKVVLGAFCIVFIALGLAWYVIHTNSKQEDHKNQPMKIGGIFSLTGNGAAYGEPARDGAVLAVEEFNKTQGKKIDLLIEDSQFDPKVALNAYQNLKTRDIHYFLTNGSPVSAVISKEVIKDQNLEYETAAVTPAYNDGKVTTCRAALTADTAGKTIAQFISEKSPKISGVAFLYAKDEYPQSMVNVITSNLKFLNVPIVATEGFLKTDTDFRSQITKLKSQENSIDMLVVIPLAGQAESVFKQLRELGWSKPIMSDNWTIINKNFKDLSLAEGAYFSNYAWNGKTEEKDSSSALSFKKTFQEKYHYDPPVIAGLTYDATMILARGLTHSDTTQPEKIGEWLSKNIKDYQGVVGPVTFNDDCEGNRDGTIQMVKNGKFESAQ